MEYHDQFLIADTAGIAPPGWHTWTMAGFHLAAHRSLPVLRIESNDGVQLGFALGHLIDRDGVYQRDAVRVSASAGAVNAQDIERLIYGFGGRFVIVLLLPHLKRIYLDSFGSLAAVWCPERRRVASTPTVLLHDEPRHPLFGSARTGALVRRPNQFYPGGLTAVDDVHRIVTNHFVDLSTWTTARHHPTAYRAIAPDEIPQTVALVHDVMRRHVEAIVRECGGAYVALTAGKDSRRALASAKEVRDRIECVTLRSRTARFGEKWHLDVHMASKVAAVAGVRHRILPMGGTDRRTKQDYLLRIGYSGGPGKSAKFDLPVRKHLDLSRGWITGHGGGMCTGSYMGRVPPGTRRLGVEDVMNVLRFRKTRAFADAVDHWLSGAPEGPVSTLIDLAILEHQGGSWVAPHMYGTAPFRMNLVIVNHRDMLDALRGLPVDYRTSGALDRDLLARAWPVLGTLPRNEYSGVTRWAVAAKSAAARRWHAMTSGRPG